VEYSDLKEKEARQFKLHVGPSIVHDRSGESRLNFDLTAIARTLSWTHIPTLSELYETLLSPNVPIRFRRPEHHSGPYQEKVLFCGALLIMSQT
jgi:hypothetical protein